MGNNMTTYFSTLINIINLTAKVIVLAVLRPITWSLAYIIRRIK